MDLDLFLVSLGLTFGIISGYIFGSSNLLYIIIGTFLIMLLSMLIKNKKVYIFYLLGFFLLFISIKDLKTDYLLIEGRIVEEIGERKYILITDKYIDNRVIEKSKDKIYINYLGEKELKVGSKLKINAEIKKLVKNTNPKLYNEKLYFNSKGIFSKIILKDENILEIKEGGNLLNRLQISFENYVFKSFNKLKEKDSDLLIALILGKDYVLEKDLLEDFRDLGIAHLLAISGLHIGILYKFVSWFLLKLGVNKRRGNLTSLLIIFIYGTLINWPISIFRGFLMLSILEISKASDYPMKSIWALQLTYIITLLLLPLSIFSISFQLSYIAIGSLILIKEKLGNFLKEIPLLNMIDDFISIQLGILPLQLYYFNSVSIIGPIANLFLIPLYSMVLILGFTLLFVPLSIFRSILTFSISVILDITRFIEGSLKSFLFLNIRSFSPDFIEILGYYLILLILLNKEKLRRVNLRTLNKINFINIVLLFIMAINSTFNSKLSLEFIDVGQGDSILIKDGKGKYLVDTGGEFFGNFSIGKNITTPYLIKNGNSKLDAVFITHFHEDHAKALLEIMEDIEIKRIYISYKPEENELYKEIKIKSIEKNIPLIKLKSGDTLLTKGGIKIDVLSPEHESYHKKMNENNLSLVLKLNYKGYNILLTGDMEKEIEENLIKENLISNVDILKVPHHGSKTSSTKEFIKTTKPKLAVFTVGENNPFSHPNPEILERYSGSKILRTDEDGMIKLELDKKSISIYQHKKALKDRNILILYFQIFFYFLLSYSLVVYNIRIDRELTKLWR